MDARVISAFTRVFDALLPAHDGRTYLRAACTSSQMRLDVTELGIDGHVRGVRPVSISVLLVEKGAVGSDAGARKLAERERLAVGPERRHALHNLHLGRFAAHPLRRLRANRLAQFARGIEDRPAAHHDRARLIGAGAVVPVARAAMKDAAAATDRTSA